MNAAVQNAGDKLQEHQLVDHEPQFTRRDGGQSIFKSGDNITCTVIGYPQRGPLRRDGYPTLSVTYSRSKISQNTESSKCDSVDAAKAVLRTLQLMLVPKTLPKSRIRCRVFTVQHGSNEIESCVNSTSLSLLQSNYDLRDMIAGVSYTTNHVGEDVFFPDEKVKSQSKKDGRPWFQFHFNKKLEVIWMALHGSADAEILQSAENVCREAAKKIFTQMHEAVSLSANR